MTDTQNKKTWRTARAGMVKEHNQQVPDSFRHLLLKMYGDNSPQLNPTLAAAHKAGWRYAALGRALYIDLRSVRARVLRARTDVQPEPVPEPPRHKPATSPLRRLTSGETAELQRLTHFGDRRQLDMRLAALAADRVPLTTLAVEIGVTRATIRRRIQRLDQQRCSHGKG